MRNRMIYVKKQYKEGKITKQNFISKMHEIHKVLWDYKELINCGNVGSINITPDNITVTTKSGISMICDPDDERVIPIEMINFGDYESVELIMIRKFLKEDSIIMDIGANIGWYSLNLSGYVPRGHIYAFEPMPVMYGYLKRNIQLNGITNVTVFNHGLSDSEEELEFYFDPSMTGATSLRDLHENRKKELVKCSVKRLDDISGAMTSRIDFVKCDVEGAELLVMRGARETILRHTPVLFLEMLRKWSAKFGYHPNDIIDFMAELDYQCFYDTGGKLVELQRMEDTTEATNFFFLNPVKHSRYLKELS